LGVSRVLPHQKKNQKYYFFIFFFFFLFSFVFFLWGGGGGGGGGGGWASEPIGQGARLPSLLPLFPRSLADAPERTARQPPGFTREHARAWGLSYLLYVYGYLCYLLCVWGVCACVLSAHWPLTAAGHCCTGGLLVCSIHSVTVLYGIRYTIYLIFELYLVVCSICIEYILCSIRIRISMSGMHS